MKRITALILTLCLCAGLCACGKSDEAQKAEELILAIGEVSLDSESAIQDAQGYYDTLTEEQKAEVENYSILAEAQEKLIEIKRNNVDHFIEEADSLLRGFEDVEGAYRLLEEASEYGNAQQCKLADALMQAIRNNCFDGTLFIKVENTVSCDIDAVRQGEPSYISGYDQTWLINCVKNDEGAYRYSFHSLEKVELNLSPANEYLDYLFGNYEELNHSQRVNGDATYSFMDSEGNQLTVEIKTVDVLQIKGFTFDITIDTV